MTWQAFILLHVVLISSRVLAVRGLARIKQAGRATVVLNAAMMTILYALGLVYAAAHWHEIDVAAIERILPWLVAGGLLFAFTNSLYLNIFAHFDSAIGTVLGTASVFTTIIFAWLLLDERLTLLQFAGVALLLPAIWYVIMLDRRSKTKLTWQTGTLFIGAAYAVVAGLAFTNEKYMLGRIDIASYILVGWGLQMVMCWVLALFRPKQWAILKVTSLWWRTVLIGVLSAAAGLCIIEAQVLSNNVSLLIVISNFRLILVALMAGWILHEHRFYLQKIAASGLATLGVFLMVWK